MDYKIPDNTYKGIVQLVASEDSVVGIDAKETPNHYHSIIHMLMDLQNGFQLYRSKSTTVRSNHNFWILAS